MASGPCFSAQLDSRPADFTRRYSYVHLENFLHRRFEAALTGILKHRNNVDYERLLDLIIIAITITDFVANCYSHKRWEGGCVVMHRSERCSLETVKRGVRLMVQEEEEGRSPERLWLGFHSQNFDHRINTHLPSPIIIIIIIILIVFLLSYLI